MPQPLTKWLPEIDFDTDALTLRPELAIYIAQVSAAWTEIQVSLGFQLAIMLHAEARTGVSMYLALTGSAAQGSVLEAAAEATLPENLKGEFADLLIKGRHLALQQLGHRLPPEQPGDEKLPTRLRRRATQGRERPPGRSKRQSAGDRQDASGKGDDRLRIDGQVDRRSPDAEGEHELPDPLRIHLAQIESERPDTPANGHQEEEKSAEFNPRRKLHAALRVRLLGP